MSQVCPCSDHVRGSKAGDDHNIQIMPFRPIVCHAALVVGSPASVVSVFE